MHPILKTLRAYGNDAREAFRVAPVEVLLGVVVAATFSWQIRAKSYFPEENWLRIVVAAWLAFSPLLALTALRLRGAIGRETRAAASGLVVLATGIYALTVFAPVTAEAWRVACLMLAGIFFVLLTPAIPPRVGDRLDHWQFAFGILGRAFGVAAYTGVLFAAMAGAVASVVTLFELKQPEHLYQDLAAWLFLAAAPWILVGGVGRLLHEIGARRERAPLAVVRFGRFLYAPVVVVYLGIVYAYALKVIFTGELPKNLVSPLVLGAGLLGMAGALLLEPVHADGEQRGLSLLVRWVPALLLPILPFAYVAILARQGQYGWTEFRYLRLLGTVLLSIVAVLGAVWLARRRMPPLASVPGILALGLLLASIGPWSAQAVSRRDQQARLRTALRASGIRVPLALPAPGGQPRSTVTIPAARFEEIRGGVQYLADAHGVEAVAEVIGPDALPYRESSWQLARAIPIRASCSTTDWGFFARLPNGTAMPVGAGRVEPLPTGVSGSDAALGEQYAGTTVTLAMGSVRGSADLSGLVRTLAGSPSNDCHGEDRYASDLRIPPAAARLPLKDSAGMERGTLILTSLRVQSDSTGGGIIQDVDGFVWMP